MKSLERRYKNINTKNPYLSSYICFVESIRANNFSERIIRTWFNKLVGKDDYSAKEKRELLHQLNNL